jgi:hypothetical protein
MKNKLKLASFALLVAGLAFTSCKKDKVTTPATEADESSTFAQHSADVNTSNNTADMSMEDAENAIAPSSMSGARVSSGSVLYSNICGASVDTTNITSNKTVVITYTGTSCDGLRNRSGSITVQLTTGNRWKDVGAVLTITYANFKVTTISTGKSTTLNGVHTITNVTGGIVNHIGLNTNPTTITRKIRANNMSITFDDGTVRSWSAARKRTWTGSGGVASSLTIEGDTTLAGVSNTEVWGTNRAGNAFTTVMNTPLVVNSTCGWYAPVSGMKTHSFNSRVSTITFGTDASGNVVSSPPCPNHYIINWTSPAGVAKYYIGTY